MQSSRISSLTPCPGHLRPVAWRPWPGIDGPASVEGAISGLPLGEIDRARVVIEGAGVRRAVPLVGARFVIDDLKPGSYRIEVRMARLVLARRLELPQGHHFVSFNVRRRASDPGRRAA